MSNLEKQPQPRFTLPQQEFLGVINYVTEQGLGLTNGQLTEIAERVWEGRHHQELPSDLIPVVFVQENYQNFAGKDLAVVYGYFYSAEEARKNPARLMKHYDPEETQQAIDDAFTNLPSEDERKRLVEALNHEAHKAEPPLRRDVTSLEQEAPEAEIQHAISPIQPDVVEDLQPQTPVTEATPSEEIAHVEPEIAPTRRANEIAFFSVLPQIQEYLQEAHPEFISGLDENMVAFLKDAIKYIKVRGYGQELSDRQKLALLVADDLIAGGKSGKEVIEKYDLKSGTMLYLVLDRAQSVLLHALPEDLQEKYKEVKIRDSRRKKK